MRHAAISLATLFLVHLGSAATAADAPEKSYRYYLTGSAADVQRPTRGLSVETLVVANRAAAADPFVVNKVRNVPTGVSVGSAKVERSITVSGLKSRASQSSTRWLGADRQGRIYPARSLWAAGATVAGKAADLIVLDRRLSAEADVRATKVTHAFLAGQPLSSAGFPLPP